MSSHALGCGQTEDTGKCISLPHSLASFCSNQFALRAPSCLDTSSEILRPLASHVPGARFRTVEMPQDNTLKGNRANSDLGGEEWLKPKAERNLFPGLVSLQWSPGPFRSSSIGSQLDTKASQGDYAALDSNLEIKVYNRRWFMLFLFSTVSASNASMWLQYGIISNIFMRFYNIDSLAIDWLSMIYLLTYIPLILPILWLLDNRGLRDVVLVGSAFNCIGAWIKVGSASPSMFPVTILGQFVCSVATVFVLGIPSHLSSVWFGEEEVSTACSIGVLGNQVCLNIILMSNSVQTVRLYNTSSAKCHEILCSVSQMTWILLK